MQVGIDSIVIVFMLSTEADTHRVVFMLSTDADSHGTTDVFILSTDANSPGIVFMLSTVQIAMALCSCCQQMQIAMALQMTSHKEDPATKRLRDQLNEAHAEIRTLTDHVQKLESSQVRILSCCVTCC